MGGINCTLSYTTGQTCHALKYLLIPEAPENEGAYGAVDIVAPPSSLLNCTFPASVRTRTRSGWYIHSALAAALADVMPDRVMAPNGLMGGIQAYGTDARGQQYYAHFFDGGGMGAGAHSDGNPTLLFPRSASNVPIEMFEVAAPVLVHEKGDADRFSWARPASWRGRSARVVLAPAWVVATGGRQLLGASDACPALRFGWRRRRYAFTRVH
jgi:N-methylhydantoinase B/oxoprolinase/acetone carboxylase alpha subunit